MPFICNGVEVIRIRIIQPLEDQKTVRLVMMDKVNPVLIDPILFKYQTWVKTFLCHMNTPQYGHQLTVFGVQVQPLDVKNPIGIWLSITLFPDSIIATKAVVQNHTCRQRSKQIHCLIHPLHQSKGIYFHSTNPETSHICPLGRVSPNIRLYNL